MTNNLAIKSILDATDSQFRALYAQYSLDKQEQFIQLCRDRQVSARADDIELQGLGVTSQQIGKTLTKIIKMASEALKKNKQSSSLLTQEGLKVSLEKKSFQIFGFNIAEMRDDECVLCTHKVCGPRIFTIKNLKTKQEVAFSEIAIHLIKAHSYFASPGESNRIDPSKICRVLELPNV